MHKAINESKKVMELQPKINEVFNEINNYADSYNSLEKVNQKYLKEIKSLKTRNSNLLQIGNEPTKEATMSEIKDYYDNKDFEPKDVFDISKGTTKDDELFEYVNVFSYLKSSKKTCNDKDKMIMKLIYSKNVKGKLPK